MMDQSMLYLCTNMTFPNWSKYPPGTINHTVSCHTAKYYQEDFHYYLFHIGGYCFIACFIVGLLLVRKAYHGVNELMLIELENYVVEGEPHPSTDIFQVLFVWFTVFHNSKQGHSLVMLNVENIAVLSRIIIFFTDPWDDLKMFRPIVRVLLFRTFQIVSMMILFQVPLRWKKVIANNKGETSNITNIISGLGAAIALFTLVLYMLDIGVYANVIYAVLTLMVGIAWFAYGIQLRSKIKSAVKVISKAKNTMSRSENKSKGPIVADTDSGAPGGSAASGTGAGGKDGGERVSSTSTVILKDQFVLQKALKEIHTQVILGTLLAFVMFLSGLVAYIFETASPFIEYLVAVPVHVLEVCIFLYIAFVFYPPSTKEFKQVAVEQKAPEKPNGDKQAPAGEP